MNVSSRSAPLYNWLADILREEITGGAYAPGDALPTELDLMQRYQLSSTTVRRAVHELVSEGWIYRKAGKGTFVRRARLEERLLRLTSFAEEMQTHSVAPGFHLLRAEEVAAPEAVAQALRLPPRVPVFYLERVQLANDEVIALAQGYWRREVGAQLARHDLKSVPLYETLEREHRIPLLEADETIGAAIADRDQAKKLGIALRMPLLVRRRITYSTNMQPIEHTTTYYRADRYEYKVRLARQGV